MNKRIAELLEVADRELGNTENPSGSNKCKYNTEYYGTAVSGSAFPWCVTFLWWCFQQAGLSELFFGGAKTASCGALLSWHRAAGQVVPVNEVQAGDIVLLNFSGGTAPEHCGIVMEMLKNGIRTIEGNTTPGLEGSQDNGGCVASKKRYAQNIVAVIRPAYPVEKDYSGHWAEAYIDKCKELGLMLGDGKGNFRPDEPLTRAELATVLCRLMEKA